MPTKIILMRSKQDELFIKSPENVEVEIHDYTDTAIDCAKENQMPVETDTDGDEYVVEIIE